MADENGPMPSEDQYNTREALTRGAVSRSCDAMDYILAAIMAFRGAERFSFNQALVNAETLYLETYVAWTSEKNDKAPYHKAHEEAAAVREKVLAVKKLLDELECEGDRLLQFVHALRT